MKARRLQLLLVVLTFAPRIVSASEPFEFVSDVIRSLESCRIADERIKGSETQDMLSLFKNIRIFANEIRQAISRIERHAESENQLIRESSNNFVNIYSGIVANNEHLLSFLEETLNNPGDAASQQGTWLRRLSENMAKNEELWRGLMYATIMSTYTMVDLNQTPGVLTITASERDSLKSDLRRLFGDVITGDPKAGLLPTEASAALLWKFLTDPWKPSDAK